MTGLIDGSFDTPEGRKVFVSRRPDESSDEFASRAMAILGMTDECLPEEMLESDPTASDADPPASAEEDL